MAPAIHLGAEKLLVIGVSSEITKQPNANGLPAGRMPGAPFLLGKVLNAFLLDHLQNDLSTVQWTNELLGDVLELGGPDMLERLNEIAASRGAAPRRMIKVIKIRPTVDIGAVAGQYLRQNRFRIHKAIGRTFLSLLDVGAGADADLASYLLFDGAFARQLIDLGRRDAAAKREELRDFLYGPN
jgi:NTE family protein